MARSETQKAADARTQKNQRKIRAFRIQSFARRIRRAISINRLFKHRVSYRRIESNLSCA